MVSESPKAKAQRPGGRYSLPAQPEVRAVMVELRRRDPHLLAIFNAWWFDLKTEASAAAVRRLLLSEGCEWVPRESRFRERFNDMRATVAEYKLQSK